MRLAGVSAVTSRRSRYGSRSARSPASASAKASFPGRRARAGLLLPPAGRLCTSCFEVGFFREARGMIAAQRRVVLFLAAGFFAAFLATGFLAVAFFAAGFLAAGFLVALVVLLFVI